jgi:hypothetical protein
MTLNNKDGFLVLIYNEIFGDYLPLRGVMTMEAGFIYAPYIPLKCNYDIIPGQKLKLLSDDQCEEMKQNLLKMMEEEDNVHDS